jgi:hypothetical protein
MPDAAGRDIGRMRVGRTRVTVDEINRRGMPQTGGISAYRVELLRPLSHPLPPFELLPLPAEAEVHFRLPVIWESRPKPSFGVCGPVHQFAFDLWLEAVLRVRREARLHSHCERERRAHSPLAALLDRFIVSEVR